MNSFLYYDATTGSIKAISPVQSEEFAKWSMSKIDIPTATKFMTGVWDTHQWYVSNASTVDKCVLSLSQFDYVVNDTDTIEVLPRSESLHNIKSAIGITIYTKLKLFEISVAPEASTAVLNNSKNATMNFIIAKRNDPTHIIGIITTTAKELFDKGTLTFDCPIEGDDFVVSTNKLFRFYQLSVRRNKMARKVKHAHHRCNTLVTYTEIHDVEDSKEGILVVHDVKNGTLLISLDGEVHDIIATTGSESATLFLTRPRDPTILIDSVKFDLRDIDSNKIFKVDIPPNAGEHFGIAGFPYVDKLSFMRK